MSSVDMIAFLIIGVGIGTWIDAEKWVGWFFLGFGLFMILLTGDDLEP